MTFKNQPLAIAPAFLPTIEALAAERTIPRLSASRAPTGSRLAFEELIGVIRPETSRPLASRMLQHYDDEQVGRVLLYVDSPGGLVTSTPELAAAVRRLASRKRVDVFTESYCCSAALWVACQGTTITASPSTLVGSIGVIHVLLDESAAAQQMGVRVVAVSSSEAKTIGVPGLEVTDAHVGMLRRLVDMTFAQFEAAIARGRGLEGKRLEAVSNGEVWYAATAKHLGLVDDVQLFEDWLDGIVSKTPVEKYAELTGQAAHEQFMALCNHGRSDDDEFCEIDDVTPAIRSNVSNSYPTLAEAAVSYENERPRRSFHSHR